MTHSCRLDTEKGVWRWWIASDEMSILSFAFLINLSIHYNILYCGLLPKTGV